MPLRLKIAAALTSLLLVLIILRCLWLWQPERQLRLHQEHLLRAAEARQWTRLSAMVDSGYTDRWGYTRATLLRESNEWLRQFFALTITASEETGALTATGGTVTERISLQGTGTPLAEMAKEAVNEVHAPCTFEWRHGSWKPWDWTLVRMDNPELKIGPPGDGPGF